MKIWKQKVKVARYGICEVREFSDKDCKELNIWCPRSHGFVNLYKDGERVAWCGVNYAEERKIQRNL